jgi:hypothetical protein
MDYESSKKITHTPEWLYHYTKLNGLRGIIKKGDIWASNFLYLNDSSELEISKKWMILEIRKYVEEHSSIQWITELQKGIWTRLRNLENPNIFVCSFTEEYDSLDQWTRYSDNGAGFCIGFDTQILSNITQIGEGDDLLQLGFHLGKCEYFVNEQRLLCRNFVTEVVNSCEQNPHDTGKEINGFLDQFDFEEKFLSFAPLIKHPRFQDENEWRLISRPILIFDNIVKYRRWGKQDIPYIEINLRNPDNSITCITDIVIGPRVDQSCSEKNVTNLMIKNNVVGSLPTMMPNSGYVKTPRIVRSGVPYRG